MNYILQNTSRPYRFTGESYGEQNANSTDSAYDRRVVIHPVSDIVELLDLKKTDFYLLDSSGSMQSHWDKLKNYKFHSSRTKVFLSTMQTCPRTRSLPTSSTRGGTHIWWSFYNLIEKMSPGQSITLVSDFETSPRLQSWEWDVIKKKLQENRVKLSDVHFIQINGAPFTRHILSTR